MKQKLVKLVALSTCAAMVASFAACGGKDTDTDTKDPVNNGSEDEEGEGEGEGEGEETYDFGGVTVKAFGSVWNNLDSEDVAWQEAKAAVEAKYNIKLEKATMDGYDGYNDDDILITSVTAGDPVADIITLNPESMVACFMQGILYDITDMVDELEIGSVYTNAATWQGRCYGVSYDNLGDCWTLVYDRDYLEEIGMEKTPTEMFMEGKWSYADFEQYCADMKAKLPEGVYPIGQYPYHWAVMAAGANGTSICDMNGMVHITDEAFIEAMEFYQKLENLGLAFPMKQTTADDGSVTQDIAYAVTDERIVMSRAEPWQLGGLGYNFGITLYPWGSQVTCEGDYTTLSENYRVSNCYWGIDCVVADSCEKLGIPGDVMTKIVYDFHEACTDGGNEWMHEAWLNEQEGNTDQVGKEWGLPRSFYTPEDIELYDWAHSRFFPDLSWAMDSAGIINPWTSAGDILLRYYDARSTLESYYNEAIANLEDAGFTF